MIEDIFIPVKIDKEQLTNHYEAFLSSLDGKKSNATLVAYRKTLDEFVRYINKRDFTFIVDDILRYKVYLERSKKLTKFSVMTYISSARQFCSYLVRIGVLEKNPVKRVKVFRKNTKVKFEFLNKAELTRFLKSIEQNTLEGLRDSAIILLLLNIGLTVKELINLNISDLIIKPRKRGFLSLPAMGDYGGELIELKPELISALQAYLRKRTITFASDPLFVSLSHRSLLSRLTQRGVRDIINHRFANSKLTRPIKHTPLTLRHTGGVMMAATGISSDAIMRRLRISSKITVEKYTEAAELFDPMSE